MSTHNLRDYKKSKVVVKDLEEVLDILTEFQERLYPYTKYTLVNHLMISISEVGYGLEAFYWEYKNVLETKGKVDE